LDGAYSQASFTKALSLGARNSTSPSFKASVGNPRSKFTTFYGYAPVCKLSFKDNWLRGKRKGHNVKRLLFVTGRPGIGKTTVLLSAAEKLKVKGYIVGGMISREVRQNGSRVGFEIIDFKTAEKGWLAHINQPIGPQVGKYKVNQEDIDSVGVRAIQTALRDADVVVIDEIGPMELSSQSFRRAVIDAMSSSKLVMGVIHQSARDPMIESIRNRDDILIETITFENRDSLHNTLIQNVLQYLQQEKGGLRHSCS